MEHKSQNNDNLSAKLEEIDSLDAKPSEKQKKIVFEGVEVRIG